MYYFKLHVGDYYASTLELSADEHGAYLMLLMAYYRSERPLPLSMKEIYRIARSTTDDHRAAVDYVLGRYFEKRADGYYNERCEYEIDVARGKVDKSKKAARARWEANKNNELPDADASSGQCLGDAQDMPSHYPTTPLPHDTSALPENPAPPSANGAKFEEERKPERKRADPRGTRIPWPEDQDEPPPGFYTLANESGLGTRGDIASIRLIDHEWLKFRDWAHSAPGSKGVKISWPATWRNWCREVRKRMDEAEARKQRFSGRA